MLRQIVLDTETTGLNFRAGNRIIEIGCVEVINRKLTGNNFHRYINPLRDSEEGALAVHGLTTEFLSDKPKFGEIITEFIEYAQGAEIIIHNAPFDLSFLNGEFALLGYKSFESYVASIVDTLVQAKELHPGKRNSLDALCDRYEVSNAHRKLHGALLDAELLADVFLAMSRGQNSFSIEIEEEQVEQIIVDDASDEQFTEILVTSAAPEELDAHHDLLGDIGKASNGNGIWLLSSNQH
jgi:DNA polymerase-3 subunit epsilon